MLVVLIDSSLVLIWGTNRDLRNPKKVWGLVEGSLRCLYLVLLIPCLAHSLYFLPCVGNVSFVLVVGLLKGEDGVRAVKPSRGAWREPVGWRKGRRSSSLGTRVPRCRQGSNRTLCGRDPLRRTSPLFLGKKLEPRPKFTWHHVLTMEEEMATHSGILAWKIPRAEEPGGQESMGLQRVGHV